MGRLAPKPRHLGPAPWVAVIAVGSLAGTALGNVVSIERASVSSTEEQARFAPSSHPSISADGRFVAFHSAAPNLVAGDTNVIADVFVRDRQLGLTERVSVRSDGGQASGRSWLPSINRDGRFVVFLSEAADLVPGDSNNRQDVFVHDRETGVTERINVGAGGEEANDSTFTAAISGNGRFVAFVTLANNLVPEDAAGTYDLFVRDRELAVTEQINVSSAEVRGNRGCDDDFALSDDGRFVAFGSWATNLVSGDTNGMDDVFVRDRQAGTTVRVSVTTAGAQGNGFSTNGVRISGDGQVVAFESTASNLVAGDTNGRIDVFVRDLHSRQTERVSVGTSEVQANGHSGGAGLNEDGRFVVFQSKATNLTPDDGDDDLDVFLHCRDSRMTSRISVPRSGEPNGESAEPSLSGDGLWAAFTSSSSNLVTGDTNSVNDVFVVLPNRAPTANAGANQSVVVPHDGNPATATAAVMLDGRGSTDPDGDTLTYSWRRAGAPIGNTATLSIDLPVGEHRIGLAVTDGRCLEDEDEVTITVGPEANAAPIANAGPDQSVVGQKGEAQVRLNGVGSSDQDSDPLTYVWKEGAAQIATGASPTVPLSEGRHILALTVRDPYGAGDSDEVVVTVDPAPGPDLQGAWQEPVVLSPPRGRKKTWTISALTVRNAGTQRAKKLSKAEIYLSDDASLGPNDLKLGTQKVGKLPAPPAAGAAKKYVLKVRPPSGVDLTQVGGKFLIARLDAAGAVQETREENNLVISGVLP